MNFDNQMFLQNNSIEPEIMSKVVDCNVYRQSEINSIVYDYGFQEVRGIQEISIANVVGYHSNRRNINRNIFESMDSFFDGNGDEYHSRSVGMLQYHQNNILKKLNKSFLKETINVCETGEGKYTIMSNGLHRYTLLRILYLKEIFETNGDKEKIEQIDKKYTIPVSVTGINLEKTYCKYILTLIAADETEQNKKIKSISSHYDENYMWTEKIDIQYESGDKYTINTNQFIEMTRQKILENKEYIDLLKNYINKYPSFKNFVQKYFSDIIYEYEEERNEGEV